MANKKLCKTTVTFYPMNVTYEDDGIILIYIQDYLKVFEKKELRLDTTLLWV